MTSAAQLKTIHTLKGRAGLEDGDYRALLVKETGKTSSKDLSDRDAVRFIDVLQGFAGRRPAPGPVPSATRATGPYAPVLQALWLAAWNLGITRSKDDSAMLKFVQRQTGVAHTRFLTDAADASRAIEGLKAWIAREGGVTWPPGRDDAEARKCEVCRAIVARLVAAGGFTPFIPGSDAWPSDIEQYGYRRGLPAAFAYYTGAHWDQLAGYLGARLRAALAGKRKAGEADRG